MTVNLNHTPMTIARKAFVSLAVALLASAAAQSSYAGLLIDRGLPTANLNNVSGANRSNVAWAFAPDTSGTWVVGDTFTNSSALAYHIDTIRVWTTGKFDAASLKLLGGLNGGPINTVSSSVLATPTTYAGGQSYQTTSGGWSQITQLDFSVSGLTLGAGQTYDFFLAGMQDSGTPYVFTHASNAALSGSPQQGADNKMLAGILSGGSVTAIETWDSGAVGGGWDKSSDLNVQVFGTVPDAGSTILLLGFALTGLSLIRRRFFA